MPVAVEKNPKCLGQGESERSATNRPIAPMAPEEPSIHIHELDKQSLNGGSCRGCKGVMGTLDCLRHFDFFPLSQALGISPTTTGT